MNKNILIVDDNPKNVQVLASFLSAAGYNISAVNSGNKVLNACVLKKYHLIILDIMMPAFDGIEVFKQLKDSSFSTIPVVFLSAKTDEITINTCLQLGALEYITKPYRQSDLLIKIEKILKR